MAALEERGSADPPENSLAAGVEGWLLGSQEFADRIKQLAKRPQHVDEVPAAR